MVQRRILVVQFGHRVRILRIPCEMMLSVLRIVGRIMMFDGARCLRLIVQEHVCGLWRRQRRRSAGQRAGSSVENA